MNQVKKESITLQILKWIGAFVLVVAPMLLYWQDLRLGYFVVSAFFVAIVLFPERLFLIIGSLIAKLGFDEGRAKEVYPPCLYCSFAWVVALGWDKDFRSFGALILGTIAVFVLNAYSHSGKVDEN